MKLKIENSGTKKFPFYQLKDENGNEFCATECKDNAEMIVKLFTMPVVSQRSELLAVFLKWYHENNECPDLITYEAVAERFLSR
jgi:hypothetical protein